MAKKVVLKGHSGAQYKEAIVKEAITPGHLVELDPADQTKGQRQVSKLSPVAVAIENHWFGKGLNDPYAVNERLAYQVLQAGAEFQALVAAANPAITAGTLVKANPAASGTVIAIGADEEALAIGKTMAAIDNSAGATQARVRVEVL